MSKSLGVFVSSDNHLEKIIEFCRAAKKKEVEVKIFFTHLGTLLTEDPRFGELEGLAELAICKLSFESHGLTQPVPGIDENGYSNQAVHSEIIEECDRYVVF